MTDQPRDIPARTIGLVDLHNTACSLVGSVIDQGDVVLIGDSESSKPYAVLMSTETFVREFGGVLPSRADDATDEATTDQTPTSEAETAEPAAPKPVPVAGQPGWWCCAKPGCAGVTDEAGGVCEGCEGMNDGD